MNTLPRSMVATHVRRCAAAVALLALLAYGAALAGEYVFDDIHSISDNPALHDLGSLGAYWTDPSTFSRGAAPMYRPALLTTFALNWAISPAAWCLKAGNVLLHAATAVLLFTWLWRLSRRLGAAAVVAALFAVHPLVSEAVNLVSSRSELLCAFGVLVGLLAHLSWQRGGGSFALFGTCAGAVLACGSKETGVILPVLCAVQAYCRRHVSPSRGEWRRTVAGLLPMVAVVVGYLIVRKLLLGQVAVPLLGRDGGDPLSGHGRTLLMQLATMGALLPKALLQAVAPVQLSLDPVVQFRASFVDPIVLIGWGSLLGLTVATLWPGPTARLRRIGVLFVWASAAAWIVVPLNQPFAEHRMYSPLLGLAAIAVALAPRLPRANVALRVQQATVAAALLIGIIGATTRSLLYRDERVLWRDELVRNPQSFRAWWGLGGSTLRKGDAAGAVEPLAHAHALYPARIDAMRHYVEALVSLPDELAQPARASSVAAQLSARQPDDPWLRTLQAQANLQAGRVLHDRDAFVRAEHLAMSCLLIAEPKAYVFRIAAEACVGLGDLEGALVHLDSSVARGLVPLELRLERAAVLHDLGRRGDARRELLRAQQQAPMDPAVLRALHYLAAPPK